MRKGEVGIKGAITRENRGSDDRDYCHFGYKKLYLKGATSYVRNQPKRIESWMTDLL